jgi:hypothetical protein
MKWPWQKGFKEERESALASLEKAKQDLNDLSKSKEDNEKTPDAIDALEKALQEFSDLENLEKSQTDEEKEKEEKEKEEELEKALQEEQRLALEKSAGDELEQELVKASEAFEGLTKSVEEGRLETQEGMELLAKGLGSLTELTLAIGQGLVALKKSQDERFEIIGKQPVHTSGALFGLGKSQTDEGGDKTPVDEARTILIKAMEDGESLPQGLLSRLDTKKDVSVIPAELAGKLNIKI